MTEPGRERKFIVDVNVGRLATWLRAMGYDTLYIPNVDDNDLIRIAYREGRTVVSRDTHFAERRLVAKGQLELVLIKAHDLKAQVRQLVQELSLSVNGAFSRCLRCNEPLIELTRPEAQPRVPVYVYRTQEQFMECTLCRRVYWRGTHWHSMRLDLVQALEGSQYEC